MTTRLPAAEQPSLRHIWSIHIDIWTDNSTILLCAIWWVDVLWRCHSEWQRKLESSPESFFLWGDTSNISYNLHQPPVRGLRPISSWHGVSGRGTSRADTRKTDSTLSPPESHSTTKTTAIRISRGWKGASKLCTENSSRLELSEKEKNTLLRLIKNSDEPQLLSLVQPFQAALVMKKILVKELSGERLRSKRRTEPLLSLFPIHSKDSFTSWWLCIVLITALPVGFSSPPPAQQLNWPLPRAAIICRTVYLSHRPVLTARPPRQTASRHMMNVIIHNTSGATTSKASAILPLDCSMSSYSAIHAWK